MKPRIRTEREASDELGEAAVWYEERRSGLGSEFLDAIDATLRLISRFPDSGRRGPGLPLDLPVRRAPVTRFPFHVVYIDRGDVIRVLAFAHDRRSPDYWHSRVSQ